LLHPHPPREKRGSYRLKNNALLSNTTIKFFFVDDEDEDEDEDDKDGDIALDGKVATFLKIYQKFGFFTNDKFF